MGSCPGRSRRWPRPPAAGPTLMMLLTAAGCAEPDPAAGAASVRNAPPPAAVAAWFTEVTAQAGIGFRHSAGATGPSLTPAIMGSGGVLADLDGDGDLDVYLVDGGSEGPAPDRLFLQQPDGRFADATATAGLGDAGYGMGAAAGDVDDDGDLDLLVTRLGSDLLYLNDGGARFRPAPGGGGLAAGEWSTSACFLDADADGALDLYVATYLVFEPPRECTDSAGNPEFCGPEAFRGLPDRLYRGRGDGRFEDATATSLTAPPSNKGLGVLCADLDGDGWTDVYVANDGEPNQLWINRGDGTFEDRAALLGAAVNGVGRPEAGMGVAAGDVDGEGGLDLFVTHLDRETNTLYAALPAGGFTDRTAASGLGPPGLPFTGFGTVLFDAELDGDLDLAVVNGRVRRGASPAELAARRRQWPPDPAVPERLADYAEPNLLFLNRGDGRFAVAAAEAGGLAARVEVSRGLLGGDVDGDGDVDLLVTQAGGPARLFRNDAPRRGRWLAVRAVDPRRGGRDVLGARVEVTAGGRTWTAPVVATTGYLTAVEPVAHFGLGEVEEVDWIEVVWPGGERERFAGGGAGRTVILQRGKGTRR